MSNLELVRAWKEPQFRPTLDHTMPDHPAGQILLPDPEETGNSTDRLCTFHHCTFFHCTLKRCG